MESLFRFFFCSSSHKYEDGVLVEEASSWLILTVILCTDKVRPRPSYWAMQHITIARSPFPLRSPPRNHSILRITFTPAKNFRKERPQYKTNVQSRGQYEIRFLSIKSINRSAKSSLQCSLFCAGLKISSFARSFVINLNHINCKSILLE